MIIAEQKSPRKLFRSHWGGALILMALPALAAETVIDFNKLPDGSPVAANTSISTQYLSLGVTFVSGAVVNPDSVLPTTLPDKLASSPPQVASILSRSGGEFKAAVIAGQFTDPHRKYIQVNVGDYGAASETASVHLGVFDGSGKLISEIVKTVKGGGGYSTVMRIDAPTANIGYFAVAAGFNRQVAIDDLRFDTPPATTAPDFTLSRTDPPDAPVRLAPGKSGIAHLQLTRFGGFAGPVTLSLAPLTGVSAVFSPNPVNGPSGTKMTATFTASSAAKAGAATAIVTGVQSVKGGPAPHSVAIPIVIRQNYQIQVTGIEVTQGIQSVNLPVRGSSGTVSYDDPAAPGVKLAEYGKTIVRVFANAGTDAPSGGVPATRAYLHGYDAKGKPLPGGVLLNEDGTHTLLSGTGVVQNSDSERWNPFGGFVFTLPPEWTRGVIRLSAQVSPPALFDAPDLADCDCAKSTLEMTDIPFTTTATYTVAPVSAFERDSAGKPVALPDPKTVFSAAANLLPNAVGELIVLPYQGAIDISDITDPVGGDSANAKVMSRVTQFASDQEWAGNRPGDAWIGVNGRPGPSSALARGLSGPRTMTYRQYIGGPSRDYREISETEQIAVVDYNRPLTSVAHELGHALGRPHADTACGGGGVADPATNVKGDILGIGLDRRTKPYQIIAPGAKGQPSEWYDYMSYCTDNYPETDSWISMAGWNTMISGFGGDGSGAARADAKAAAPNRTPKISLLAAAATSPILHVIAWGLESGQVEIASVSPRVGTPDSGPPNSHYTLVVRDAQGVVVGQSRMQATEEHSNHGGEILLLMGEAAAANAAAVEIRRDGQLVASRQRSAQAPVVTIVRPAEGDQAGGNGTIEVEWFAQDSDSNALTTSVDYSSDDGATWKPLFVGPNRNTAALPGTLASGSRTARVRVRVNDGFNETSVVSGRFVSAGAAPQVRISSPVSGDKIAVGSSLYLSGEAFDDHGAAIQPRHLSWSINGESIGSGRAISFRVPPIQNVLIGLRVADEAGRAGQAAIRLLCTAEGQNQGGACIVQ